MTDRGKDQDAPDNCAEAEEHNDPLGRAIDQLSAAWDVARRKDEVPPGSTHKMFEGLVLNWGMFGKAAAELNLAPRKVLRQLEAVGEDSSEWVVIAFINRRKPPKSWESAANECGPKKPVSFHRVRGYLHTLLRELCEGNPLSPESQEFMKTIASAEVDQWLVWRDGRFQPARGRTLKVAWTDRQECMVIPWEYWFVLNRVAYWQRMRGELPFRMCQHGGCQHPAFVPTWGEHYCPIHQTPKEKQRRHRRRQGGR